MTPSRQASGGLKAMRDQARTDAERARATLDGSGNQSITPDMVQKVAATAATIFAPSPKGSKSPNANCATWDQKAIYSEP